MSRLVGLLVFVMLLVGCSTDQQTIQLIEQAEQVMIDHPDSALNIIRSVDAESIRGEEDMAHYRLVMAEACYYNRIVPSRDSIAEPLFEYYLDSDDHAMRARALYQHALVMQSDGDNAKAMYSLLEAEKSLSHTDNHRLAGLVHRTKGEIYGSECLFSLSLDEHQKAKEMFDKAGLSFHSAYALYDIAKVYRCLRDFDLAVYYLMMSEDKFYECGYAPYVFDVQIELCYNYMQKDEYENMSDVLSRIDISDTLGHSLCDYYSLSAVLSAYDKRYDVADSLITRAKQEYITNPLQLAYCEYMVNSLQGKHLKAHELYVSLIAEQDKAVYNLINNSLLQSQIELLENERVIIEERTKSNRIRLISVIVTLFLITITISLYARYQRVKRSRDIANYINIIAELKHSLNVATPNECSSNINADFIELNKICEIYYQYGKTSNISGKVLEAVNESIELLKTDANRMQNLENIVNSQNHNILSAIREDCPKINDKEYRYIVYYLLGFSTRSIAMLLDINTNALARLKYKVKVKLRECENDKIGMLLS